jgi:hypothetical protein
MILERPVAFACTPLQAGAVGNAKDAASGGD